MVHNGWRNKFQSAVPYPDVFSYRWISMGAQIFKNFIFLTLISLITAHSSYLFRDSVWLFGIEKQLNRAITFVGLSDGALFNTFGKVPIQVNVTVCPKN